MSVRNTKLLMYGVEIQYPHYQSIVGQDDEKYDELDVFYDETPGKVGMLTDGMNGEYAVAGTILRRLDDEQAFPNGVTKIDDLFTIDLSDTRKKEIEQQLEKIMGYIPKCSILFVNHWH